MTARLNRATQIIAGTASIACLRFGVGGGWSLEFEVWSLELGVWSLELGVKSLGCNSEVQGWGVEGVLFDVWRSGFKL